MPPAPESAPDAAPDAALATLVRREERRLLAGLTGLAVTSIAAGVAVRRALPAAPEPPAASPLPGYLRDVARQAVAWGVVDLAIAAWGVRGMLRSRREPLDDVAAAARARWLARVTGVNAVLDVGYVAAGAALAARAPDRRGDGAGIVLQGLALLRLDVVHASSFRAVSSRVRGRPVGPRT